jgi:hypothetical protein
MDFVAAAEKKEEIKKEGEVERLRESKSKECGLERMQ